MGENSLRELEPLAGFQQLYGLRLSGNRLRNLTAETFVHSLHIKMLNVADNLLEHIDQSTFEPLKHLKVNTVHRKVMIEFQDSIVISYDHF